MTDTTDPTKPVATVAEIGAGGMKFLAPYPIDALKNLPIGTPLYGPSLLSEYERVKAENVALAAHACVFIDGSGVTGDEHGNSICLVTRRSEALEAENKRLSRLATDRLYMMEAYKAMLGPAGLQVVKTWEEMGVTRQHTSWGPEAHKLTGEERAQAILEMQDALSKAQECHDDI